MAAASGSGQALGQAGPQAGGLSLKPLRLRQPVCQPFNLHSGTGVQPRQAGVHAGEVGLKLDYDGGFAVDDLAITEEQTEEAFLAGSVCRRQPGVQSWPHRLSINELVGRTPSQGHHLEDKTINLQRILRKPATTHTAAVESTRLQTVPSAPEPQNPPKLRRQRIPAFPLAIERLRIIGPRGIRDLSLTPQFGTRMHDLGGVVTGLSTDASTTAQVELDGKVDDYGSARVRGRSSRSRDRVH